MNSGLIGSSPCQPTTNMARAPATPLFGNQDRRRIKAEKNAAIWISE